MELTSIWKGSERTYQEVKQQIEDRFGPAVAANYNPERNCFTFAGWKQRGFKIKKGEVGMRILTFIEVDDELNTKRVPKTIYLFAEPQVEKVS